MEIYSILRKYQKKISPYLYDPVSYEQWKMLRELESTKFIVDYEFYVKLKMEQYNNEVERRKTATLELVGYMYNLHPTCIIKTKEQIRNIESDPLFEKWQNDEIKEQILNYHESNE